MSTLARGLASLGLALTLAACDDTTGTLSVSGGDPLARQCGDILGTGTGDPNGSHRIGLEMTGLPATWSCDARVRVTVFGYDRLVADVAATALLEVVDPIPANGAMTLHIDRTDFQRIAIQAGVTSSLGYYLDVDVDLDGDGRVCGTDLSQNFDVSPLVFFGIAEDNVASTVVLKANGDLC